MAALRTAHRIDRWMLRTFSRLRTWVLSTPPVSTYRIAKRLAVLRSVAKVIEDRNLPCLIGGGFAYAALRGRVERAHSDVDLMCLADDFEKVVGAFVDEGFVLLGKAPPYKALVASPIGLPIDLYGWRDAGDGMVQYLSGSLVTRMPREWFSRRQRVTLEGITFPIPCNENLRAIGPYIRREVDRRFVESLPSDGVWKEIETKERILEPIDVTVREVSTVRESG